MGLRPGPVARDHDEVENTLTADGTDLPVACVLDLESFEGLLQRGHDGVRHVVSAVDARRVGAREDEERRSLRDHVPPDVRRPEQRKTFAPDVHLDVEALEPRDDVLEPRTRVLALPPHPAALGNLGPVPAETHQAVLLTGFRYAGSVPVGPRRRAARGLHPAVAVERRDARIEAKEDAAAAPSRASAAGAIPPSAAVGPSSPTGAGGPPRVRVHGRTDAGLPSRGKEPGARPRESVRVESVFAIVIEDRRGMLAALAWCLADAGVAVEGVCQSVEAGVVVVRILVDDSDRTRETLRSRGYPFFESRALVLHGPSGPAELAKTTDRLAMSGVNIAHAWGLSGGDGAGSILVLQVDDIDRAVRAAGD